MRFVRLIPLLSLAACAAEPASPIDLVEGKEEAVIGQLCGVDGDCDSGEYCSRPVCITFPCDFDGRCEAQFHFDEEPLTAIPDADPRGVSRTFTVANPGATVESVSILVAVEHSYRGDLRIALRSPSGTERVLHDRTGGSGDDVLVSESLDAFSGELASGDWKLTVSDHARADLGRIARWRLVFTYGAPAQPTTDVWSTLFLPGIQSDHDYVDHTDQSWDLARFTGSATRTRVRFSRIDVERNYDFVELVDGDTGRVLQRFTGPHTDVTSNVLETGNVQVRLVTDYSVTDWGFAVEAIEVYGAGCLNSDECMGTDRCTAERIRCITFPCFGQCEPGSGGNEGDPCASSSECNEELYCAGDGTCRADMSCGELSDCSAEGNAWIHILCAGYPVCESNMCGWRCGFPGGGDEGDACDDSSPCRLGLYCGSGDVCRAPGSCAADSDCNTVANTFVRPTCAEEGGFGVCNPSGLCDWECPPPLECRDGETRQDDCNTCDCVGGSWRCTLRFCPAPAEEGEECGTATRIECAEGLVCDLGAAPGVACGDVGRPGVCVDDGPRACAEIYAPVCGCNGQTFENDCSRQSLAAWSHTGRCDLAVDVPDADATGVRVEVDAAAGLHARYARVEVEIDHSWRGDLVVTLTAPNGDRSVLTQRQGGSADDFDWSGTFDLGADDARGTWTLHVADHASRDLGVIRYFQVSPN